MTLSIRHTKPVRTGNEKKREDADEARYPSSDGKPMAETPEHRDIMLPCIDAARVLLQQKRPRTYVSGNDFIYYEAGTQKRVSPDCYVVLDVDDKPTFQRRTFKTWEEGDKLPAFVLEITSKKTRKEDVTIKAPLYEQVLHIGEYFRFDPTGDYLKPRLQGGRLENGAYVPLELVDNRLYSEVLDAFLVIEGRFLRLVNAQTGEVILTGQERHGKLLETQALLQEEARRAELAEAEAQTEAQRAQAEAQRADEATAEVARLRAQLDAFLRQQTAEEKP